MSALALSLVLLTGMAPAADAPPKVRRVAVLPLETGKGVEPELGKTLAGALLGEVRKARGSEVNVMAPDDVIQALPDALRGRLKRCERATCKAQMAQAVNADRALGGSVSKVGGTLVLNLALLEAADGAQVAQWTGKAPEGAPDKLLDQLAGAVAALFPAPKGAEPPPPAPVPVAATQAPQEPVPPPPAPTPLAATPPPQQPAPPPPLTAVAPILPPDEPPAAPLAAPPPTSQMVIAMQDPSGVGAQSAAQQAQAAQAEEEGWSGKLIGAAVGVLVPGVAVGVLMLVAGVGATVGAIASRYWAVNINNELKAVPHKTTGSFPLASLILLGQWLERLSFILIGLVGVAALLGVLAFGVGLAAGIGLLVAAAPKTKARKSENGAEPPPPSAAPSPSPVNPPEMGGKP